MRLQPTRLATTLDAAVDAATTSPTHFNAPGRRPWRRSYSDGPPPPTDGTSPFFTGDPNPRPNDGFQQPPPQQHLRSRPPPVYHRPPPPQQFNWRPPPSYRPPAYGPPPPNFRPPPPYFGPNFRQPPPHFGPPPNFRPGPRPRPPDHRNWVFTPLQPPPQSERFTVVSYNILADYLAREHRPKLYFHVPHHVLDWEWRKRRLMIEFGLWNPDIMCLQEVDRFHDIEEELTVRGYTGVWKMRTGNAIDGCAIFWRMNRFHLRHEEHIEYSKHELRDNVAQICVLESRSENTVESATAPLTASSDEPKRVNQIVVCNIHVLYNPKRGEIKLGQVRLLLDRAYAISRNWNDAPVVICGDFNSTPKSPLYNFIAEQKLSLSGVSRDQVSGQYSASIYPFRPYVSSGLYRAQPKVDNSSENNAEQGSKCNGSPTYYKPQNDIGNASPTEKYIPESSTGLLHIDAQSSSVNHYITRKDTVSKVIANEKCETDMHHDQCSKPITIQYAFVGKSTGTVESCNEQSQIPFNVGSDEKEQSPSVSCSSDPCFEGIQQEHGRKGSVSEMIGSIQIPLCTDCSESTTNTFIESIDKFHQSSSFGNHELPHTSIDYSTAVKTTANFYVDDASANQKNASVCETWTENTTANGNQNFESTKNLSCNMIPEEAVVAKTVLVNRLVDDSAKEISSSKMFSGTIPVTEEASSIENVSNVSPDLIPEQDDGCVVSYENSPKSSLPNLVNTSSLDTNLVELCVDEGGKNHSGNVDVGTTSSSRDTLRCDESNTAVHDTCHSNNSTESNSEVGCPFLENSALADELRKSQFNDPITPGQGDLELSDSCCLEENSDPNFFKELLGTDDVCGYREETDIEVPKSHSLCKPNSDPSSAQVREDSSSLVGPHAAGQEKHSYNPYNPYLWTPMEIEVASGNAESTFIEHRLKLRSAYTDVEDYAGTKDSSREPQVTSYHRQFMGTVDYIWYSEGLQTVKVLDTIPKHVLQRTPGFPTQKWGSDHIALACQFSFMKGQLNKHDLYVEHNQVDSHKLFSAERV